MHLAGRIQARTGRFGLAAALISMSASSAALAASTCAAPPRGDSPVEIAIFDFELEDRTPASALLNEGSSSASSLDRATQAARRELARSAHYRVLDGNQANAAAVLDKSLRNCEGCEARIASQLGAQQSLIGIIRRVTQTDYYVQIQVRDVCSGQLLDEEAANFAGGEEGWATGVRMLIRHQVLPTLDPTADRGSGDALRAASSPCKTAVVNPVTGFAECVDPRGAPVPSPMGVPP